MVIGGGFAILWRTGQVARLATYTAETREELRKCTWPSVDELKGNTIMVIVTIALMGFFTVAVDYVLAKAVQFFLQL